MTTIQTDNELDAFRAAWSGERILQLLRQHDGRMIINWPVGIGKSRNIDDVVEAVVAGNAYDLVIVLCPTRRIINERRWVLQPSQAVRIVILRPRPVKMCGPQRNRDWVDYETTGMGLLGRKEICDKCPHRQKCFWPTQYGKSLRGTRVIFATQAHLERDAAFTYQLSRWTGAKRILVVLDEDKAILSCFRRQISGEDLKMFQVALDTLQHEGVELENGKNSAQTC